MSRALWTLAVLLSHWRRHPMQLATLLIGLISATALWSGVQALNAQARTSYDRAAATFGGARTAMLVGRNGATFSQQLFVDLRRAGWPVSPVLEGRLQIGGRSFRLLGHRTGHAARRSRQRAGDRPRQPASLYDAAGRNAGGARDAFRSPSDGRRDTARKRRHDVAAAARPAATGAGRAGGRYRHRAAAAENAGSGFPAADRQRQRPTRAPLETVVGDKLRLVEPDAESDLERLTDSFHLNLTAFGLLSFVVGLFIVNSAIGLAFEQRLPMLRTLRACGVSARMLNTVLVIELVSLALVAGLIGLVCGYLIAASLLPDVAASLRGLYGAQIPGQLTLKREWWIAGIVISVVGALVGRRHQSCESGPPAGAGGSAALCLATGAAPLADLAERAGARRTRCRRLALVRRFAGVRLCGAGSIAARRGAWRCPWCWTRACARPARARRPLVTWFWADSRQQLSGLSLALMALLLALAVNVGVGTMVETFSRTFVSWLDGRLAADVYLNAADDAQASDIQAWLRERPEVKAVLPGGRADTQLAGAPIEILACPITPPIAITGRCCESAANAWVRLRPGDAGFISEQLARRLKLGIGDRIEVPAAGGNWTLEIVGIYADYGNPKGQIAVNYRRADAALSRHPANPDGACALRRRGAGADRRRCRKNSASTAATLADQATLKAESTRIFNRTFAVTAALNAFTLGVAGIALLTSLLTLSNSRLPQLAPLWAIGITRRQLAAIEL